MAVSLDSTVPGDPNEIIDVDGGSLPLFADEVDQVSRSLASSQRQPAADEARTVQRSDSGQEGAQAASSQSQSEGEPTESEQSRTETDVAQAPDSDQQVSQTASAQLQSESSGERTASNSSGTETNDDDKETLLQQLLDHIVTILASLVVFLASVYKRSWIRDRLRSSPGGDGERKQTADGDRPADRSPENEVERIWIEMVSRAGVDIDPTETPRECAQAAIQAGLDRDAVMQLTTIFEAVRYGDKQVTEELTEAASRQLERATVDDQSTGNSDD